MKHVWKVLGAAALIAGLSPYRVTTDKASGDKKIRALLWKATYGGDPENKGLSLNFGFFPPNEEEEAHLFADELVVHYHGGQPCCADEAPCCQEEPCCGCQEAEGPAGEAETAAPEEEDVLPGDEEEGEPRPPQEL